jgi:bifunctional oligoribonuclease and PAP phosphatase NrnA
VIAAPRLQGARSTLERARRPAVICHLRPDGDAMGSLLGLVHGLRRLGADPVAVCVDPVPNPFWFLPGANEVQTVVPDDVDLIVTVDCGSDHLTGFEPEVLAKVPRVDIDHHVKPDRPPTPRLAVYDSTAASTTEMLYEIFRFGNWPIDRTIATCLLTGIITDTLAFRNANVSPRTLQAAADLLHQGGRLKDIIKHCFYSSSIAKLRLWGIALARIEQNPTAAGIVSTVLTREDIEACGATAEDIDGLVNFLKSIPGVPVTLLLTDMRGGEVKGSFRTTAKGVDVSRLARLFGGGGHRQAAGFTVAGQLVKNVDDSWQVAPPTLS